MSDHDYLSFQDPYRRWSAPEPSTSLTSILLAIVVGACVFVKALELAGYPVWLWTHQLVQMSLGPLQLRGTPLEPSHNGTNEDTLQRAGGMLSSIDGLFRRGVRGITGALSSGPSNVPPGLGNISNSCYQNSIIQGLAALPSLRDYLSQIATEHPSFTTDTTTGALHDLLSKLNDPENRGQNFWIPGKLKSMSTFTQQDAQEYYSKILDELDMEVKKASSSKRRSSVSWLEATRSLSDLPPATDDEEVSKGEKTEQEPLAAEQSKTIPNPLDGLIAQRVGCTSCGYSEGLSLISFNCITVSLGSSNSYDIRECLDEYTDLEHIDGVECAKCTLLKLQKTLTPLAKANPGSQFETRLNAVLEILDDEKFEDSTLVKTLNIPKKNWTQSRKSKQIVVARAPTSLVLHVNRSIFDETTGAQYKNTADVSYPSILDLGDWCLGTAPSGSGQPDVSLEEWPRDPKTSMLAATQERLASSPFQYRLRAVITHAGTHGYGHYVCFRPHAKSMTESAVGQERADDSEGEQWWRFSDDHVYATSEAQAHRGDVFMLFYERLDDSTTSQPLRADPLLETFPVADDAPLPPEDIHFLTERALDDKQAAAVPLPDDDELFDLAAPERAESSCPSTQADDNTFVGTTAYPTPPPEIPTTGASKDTHPELTIDDTEPDISEAESEDAPRTHLTSNLEAGLPFPPISKPYVPMPPHVMRTAGNAAARGQGNRQSLPMVSAT